MTGFGRRLHGAWRVSGALLVSSSFVSAVAGAEQRLAQESYGLRWVREGGAESCASGAALGRMLEQLLGEGPKTDAPALLLEGLVQAAPPPMRYSVRVTVRNTDSGEVVGERELSTADPECSALTPAVLLVLAMSVDPNVGRVGLPRAVAEERERSRDEKTNVASPELRSPAGASAKSLPQRTPDITPGRSAEHGQRPSVVSSSAEPLPFFAAVATSTAILPSIAVGGAVGTRLPLRRGWLLALTVFGWNPQTAFLPESPFLEDGGVTIAAGQLSAALCRSLWGQRLELSACGGFGAGVRWVKAEALPNEDNPMGAFFGPELVLEASFRPDSAWFVAADAGAQGQLRRDHFVYRNHVGQLVPWFEPSPFSGRAWLSIGVLL